MNTKELRARIKKAKESGLDRVVVGTNEVPIELLETLLKEKKLRGNELEKTVPRAVHRFVSTMPGKERRVEAVFKRGRDGDSMALKVDSGIMPHELLLVGRALQQRVVEMFREMGMPMDGFEEQMCAGDCSQCAPKEDEKKDVA